MKREISITSDKLSWIGRRGQLKLTVLGACADDQGFSNAEFSDITIVVRSTKTGKTIKFNHFLREFHSYVDDTNTYIIKIT